MTVCEPGLSCNLQSLTRAEGFGLDTGSDGSYPYQYSEGSDFAKNLAIPTIDFGTFHLYPSSCKSTSVANQTG